jgi:hypothetical protein
MRFELRHEHEPDVDDGCVHDDVNTTGLVTRDHALAPARRVERALAGRARALRAAPTPAAALERMLPVLRQTRELPSERVIGRAVDGQGDETVIWIAQRGIGDDSVAGVDYTIRVTTGAGELEVVGAASRSACARGIGADSCL